MARVSIPITEANYGAALKRIELLMERDDEGDDAELEALALLVENYEPREFPMPQLDPVEAIRFRMAQLGLDQAAVARWTGIGRSHVSEILNGKRPLSLDAIRRLAHCLDIPVQILIESSNAADAKALANDAG